MRAAVMRWRSSWRRGDMLFALLLLAIAAAIVGLPGLAIEVIGRL
jgi:hypothetical protein